MRKFIQNKLWRDKAITMMENQGSRIHWRYLTDSEFLAELGLKLIEEAHEVSAARNRIDVINELADVYEVIDSIAAVHTISKEEILAAQAAKHHERGGFLGRRFVEIAEHPTGSFGEKYCLADPEKYPEVE